MLGTSDAWSMSRLSHRPSKPAYYIEDCWILTGFVLPGGTPTQANGTTTAAPLPFDAKLENELASAPKGLILIVKEPGESKLIAGKVSNT